jgi:uncharacterized membrane protein
MPAIFISYRRDDTVSATGRLADALAARFGAEEIFRDIHGIEAGADFRDALRDALRAAQVVLVVIGRFWAGTRGSSLSRLHDPGDYVRLEIETALAQDVQIVPVIVEGARMPAAEDLPESIRPLAYRHAHELSDSRWAYDFDRLVELLARRSGLVQRAPSPASPSSGFERRRITAAFSQLPADFLGLVYEPQRFLSARAADGHDSVMRACVFLVVSQLLGAFLLLLEWPTRSSPIEFAATAPVLLLLVGFVLSLPMYLAWRLAGAPREYRRILVIFLYQCSFAGLCASLVMFVMLVGVKMVVPQAVDDFAAAPTVQAMSVFMATLESAPGNTPWVIGSLIAALIGVGLLVWLAGSWAAYRLTLGQSRLRSLAALTLFAIFVTGPVAFLVWAASLL